MDEVINWPDCIVLGCPRKCCLALNSDKCFPHTKGNEHIKRWKIEARNALNRFSTASRTNLMTTDFGRDPALTLWVGPIYGVTALTRIDPA